MTSCPAIAQHNYYQIMNFISDYAYNRAIPPNNLIRNYYATNKQNANRQERCFTRRGLWPGSYAAVCLRARRGTRTAEKAEGKLSG